VVRARRHRRCAAGRRQLRARRHAVRQAVGHAGRRGALLCRQRVRQLARRHGVHAAGAVEAALARERRRVQAAGGQHSAHGHLRTQGPRRRRRGAERLQLLQAQLLLLLLLLLLLEVQGHLQGIEEQRAHSCNCWRRQDQNPGGRA
jgi:hypothetical protein